jgi:hypothetical protein
MLFKLALTSLGEGESWKDCAIGGLACFRQAVHAMIRTPYDFARIMHAVHNIVVAATWSASSRAAQYTEFTKPYSSENMIAFRLAGQDVWPSIWYDGSSEDKSAPLRDKGLSKHKVRVGLDKVRQKMEKPLIIPYETLRDYINKGYNKFIEQPFDANLWPHYCVYMQLITGARRIELLTLSDFLPLTEEDRIGITGEQLEIDEETARWRSNDKYIKQLGKAKGHDASSVKGSRDAFRQPTAVDTVQIIKPLLGPITATRFVDFHGRFRAAVIEALAPFAASKKVAVSELTRKDVTGWANAAIQKAFRSDYADFLRFVADAGFDFNLHAFRAIYGFLSHMLYQGNRMSLTFWISRVLGHDASDMAASFWYQTTTVLPPQTIKDMTIEGEMQSMRDMHDAIMKMNEEKLKMMEELLQLAKDNGEINGFVNLPDRKGEMVRVKSIIGKSATTEQRRQFREDTKRTLATHGIMPSATLLRRLGWGSAAIAREQEWRKSLTLSLSSN